jgi:hypothetical protein
MVFSYLNFRLQQISQVEILLGDQVQDMLAQTLMDSTAAADP